jgi:hypothetical protein|tara:strand:- start:1146 stop:1532 length:387 start_codon:yes stop_codon:yes gene_type:complete
MPRSNRLSSDHFITKFNTDVREPSGKDVRGNDGRPVKDWMTSGDLTQITTYNGHMERLDGRWSLVIKWVDFDNNGHRVVFPHEVVQSINRSRNTIIKNSKSEGARKAYDTRLEDGTVPDAFVANRKGV